MAGITGIISLGDKQISGLDPVMFARMKNALGGSQQQAGKEFLDKRIFVANKLPVLTKNNDRFCVNERLGVVCVLDGTIYIQKDPKREIVQEYSLSNTLTDHQLLPYLFRKYEGNLALHIEGSYNLLCYDICSGNSFVINDRLGFLPLYCYGAGDYFVFGSKIECILSSGLLAKIEFDKASIAEHLFFNYVISDYTYIEGVSTLPNASIMSFCDGLSTKRRYWKIGDDFSTAPLPERESYELIDLHLLESTERLLETTQGLVNFSLTGGWDSRLVLSYLMPHYRDRLRCYSFGSEQSDDVLIPKHIANREKLAYTPYILDEPYLNENFLDEAKRTVELSGGTRNFKRAHYLYAIQKMGSLSDTLLTGIFGDEVLKVGKPQGGAVISTNTVAMLEKGFDPESFNKLFELSSLAKIPGLSGKDVQDAIFERVNGLYEELRVYPTASGKYLAFRFEINLRKYFGNEASSYNDHCFCYSPFIDYGFLRAWLNTKYAGHLFDFSAPKLKYKKQSSDLYTKLVLNRYPALARYPSSRGYSMMDTTTVFGKMKIMHKRFIHKRNKPQDAFFTADTDMIFADMLMRTKNVDKTIIDSGCLDMLGKTKTDALSLLYWISHIQKNYV